MQIQVNTDSHITGSEEFTAKVEQKISNALKRFAEHITRIEVHFSDLNSGKAGPDDKRCVLEARVAGLNPISVSHQASTLALAVDGTLGKMTHALDTAFGKRNAARHDQVVASDQIDPTD